MRPSICMLALCLAIGGCREAVPAASASDTASDRVIAGLSLDRLRAGGFGTHFWVDPKENLACLILTQVAPIGPFRQGPHAMFRHLVYASLVN